MWKSLVSLSLLPIQSRWHGSPEPGIRPRKASNQSTIFHEPYKETVSNGIILVLTVETVLFEGRLLPVSEEDRNRELEPRGLGLTLDQENKRSHILEPQLQATFSSHIRLFMARVDNQSLSWATTYTLGIGAWQLTAFM